MSKSHSFKSKTSSSKGKGKRRRRRNKGKQKRNYHEFGIVGRHRVRAGYDGEEVTSFGGVLPFFEVANKIDLFKEVAKIFPDYRDPNMVTYTTEDLIRQIAFGDLVGRHDFSDHQHLRHDPLMAVVLNHAGDSKDRKETVIGAGKDTIQRLVDAPSKQSNAEEIHESSRREINKLLMRYFVAAKNGCVDEDLDFDLDAFDIVLYSDQEGNKYNSYYGNKIYFMQVIYCDNYPVWYRLITADHGGAHEADEMIREAVDYFRELVGGKVKVTVRADAAFCVDEIMSYAEEQQRAGNNTHYHLRLPANSVLDDMCADAFAECWDEDKQEQLDRILDNKEAYKGFLQFDYRTKDSWSQTRKVSAKVEVHQMQGSLFPYTTFHYVISSLDDLTPEEHFEKYNQRGNMENWGKELKLYEDGGHASMSKLNSNSLRLGLKIISQFQMQLFRDGLLKGTKFEKATSRTIREKLVHIGARVYDSHRQFYVSIARSFTFRNIFDTVCKRIDKFATRFQHMLNLGCAPQLE